jgi:hypothetical protein
MFRCSGWKLATVGMKDHMFVLGPQTFIFANNRHDHHNGLLKQMGGTGVVAMLGAKNRVFSKGEDPHKLGRWAWMLLQGRQG